MTEPPSPASSTFRAAIEQFLKERCDAKLDKLSPDDPKREALVAQFRLETWIADAAERARHIKLATHVAKATHPSSKGSSLYKPPDSLPAHDLVGTHSVGDTFVRDAAVANARHLDVYSFLQLIVDDAPLLDYLLANCAELRIALSDDPDAAAQLTETFVGVSTPQSYWETSTLAKQIYWLTGDDPTADAQYHLLGPLYASSLAHAVFATINEDRFGEAAKLARKARRERQAHDGVSREYRNLAEQNLGGSNAQNVSQLNQKRRGKNYLLASLPPHWKSRIVQEPWHIESVFPRFGKRKDVRPLVRGLRKFLEANPNRTMETRDRRDDFTDALIGELAIFAAELRNGLAPGWSQDARCQLVDDERLWLDPGRAESDEGSRAQLLRMDWPAEIAKRFGNWLNGQLDGSLPVGDAEHRHWASELAADMEWARQVDQTRRTAACLDAGVSP